MNRPIRKSSEAPQVVDTECEAGIWGYGERLERNRPGAGTLSQKQLDPFDTESSKYLSPILPTPRRDTTPSLPDLPIEKRRMNFGLTTTIFLVSLAFIIGGGVGGGIGGALVAKERSKTCSIQPTSTNTASPPTQTTLAFDTAGCPGINQDRYNSTTPGKHFLQSCYMDIVPQPGENISMGNKTVESFNDCLNSCAQLDGCLAATWVMFSSSAPRNNAVCFFKNSVGTQSPQVTGDSLVTGFMVT
ncbi:hypothetical protein HYFRA_00010725 [Hymenoscyphus fraxineus]|uniref:Apple domain-containing protein n=1 Tax=Hymenoscyphus fraxineus TaxID=746836 RepID=A0A9N9L4A7_9HELO|nr:hypothetical protein HYFRA_00010725 [Hymenoscyphus fraxineus]